MQFEQPVLFSFRRCPYAIRARLALALAGISYNITEVDLKNKPERLLQLSPKGTVPVLVFADGNILEQSVDIMLWALHKSDPLTVLPESNAKMAFSQQLITENDGPFKQALDRYKYPHQFLEHSALEHQSKATNWIVKWNALLANSDFFLGSKPGLVDYALMPFVRQFAATDQDYFNALPVEKLQTWLAYLTQTELFKQVMRKI